MKKITIISQIVVFAGFLALIIFAVILLRKDEVPSTSAAPVPTINRSKPSRTPGSPGEGRRQQEIDRIETRLADKALRPDTRKLLTERLAFVEKQATLLAFSPNPYPVDVIETVDPIADRGIEAPDGIVYGPVPFLPSIYIINDTWKGKNGKEKVLVYAGVKAKERDQGIVIVRLMKTNEDFFYPAPKKSGGLSIAGYKGTILQLRSEQGDTFEFDVSNNTYLGYPEYKVGPTNTPNPYP